MSDSRYDELVAHGVQSIMNATVHSKPYPHMAFANFWPDDFYRELIAKRPEPENSINPIGRNARSRFIVFDGDGDAGGEGWPVKMYPRPAPYADYDGYAITPHPEMRRD
ncbi:hypothetical protein K9U39_09685 [Rhodoblastus acidophilus]|uniref:Uncharacterized protein n=1 Tax=Candidatus Rhodoblastus alkanivorans TaxID=2954117 RepID=A0ABS9Z8G1_9HYPH|nr:hypothetical protein [Candidatus Rhodoblastus alkanivorans]MCI4677997.1 hypothetical protein [Candidatus Rhodoblastus alkanivorans]MCI4683892.1 hypothetical protein [Candidatus Rhodoblastus alkanivorans]MDI4641210.1 hypothetical protein [Rhodoblastus acidophilus]